MTDFGVNAGYVEELHARYRDSPQSVAPEWRAYFEGAPPPGPPPGAPRPRGPAPGGPPPRRFFVA